MEPNKPMVTATVTLPPDLRDKLDTEAARQDRSRSWITAEAIKQYLARREGNSA
jgi:predicted transcriptional regulator